MNDLTAYGFIAPQARPKPKAEKPESQNYIECDWAELRCVVCNHLAVFFDEKMYKDPAFGLACYFVMKKHKDETGHDQWQNIPKWNNKDGLMPTSSK